jgi:hypothetical protein
MRHWSSQGQPVGIDRDWHAEQLPYDSAHLSAIIPAMGRMLVWKEKSRFQGWGCSHCGWIFNPTGPPIGETMEEMMRIFVGQRDKEFQSHLCAEHVHKIASGRKSA